MSPRAGPLAPGSVIGILGGGQLGRMTALAAARLGYRCHIFADSGDAPALQVAAERTVSGFEDAAALARFASRVDVVTLEFENVPIGAVRALEPLVPVRPGGAVLAVCQDRLEEKAAARDAGFGTADYRRVDGPEALRLAVRDLGTPSILKATRLGYDGKAQTTVRDGRPETLAAAWAAVGRRTAILEAFVPFIREVSVIAARAPDGAIAAYEVVENQHQDHVLKRTLAPARVPLAVRAQADAIARGLAERLGVGGLLAVEMFQTEDDRLLVNEMAPRPHNSGHWTQDGAVTDQFEQAVRAVCGLPLGSPERHSETEMINLLGDEVDAWPRYLARPGDHLHLYGKADARPGRKMGHVNRVKGR